MTKTTKQNFEAWVKASVPYLPLDWSDEGVMYTDPRTEVAFYAYQEGLIHAKRAD